MKNEWTRDSELEPGCTERLGVMLALSIEYEHGARKAVIAGASNGWLGRQGANDRMDEFRRSSPWRSSCFPSRYVSSSIPLLPHESTPGT